MVFTKKNNGFTFKADEVVILFAQLILQDITDKKFKQYLITFIQEGNNKKDITSNLLLNLDKNNPLFILSYLLRSHNKTKAIELFDRFVNNEPDIFKNDCIDFITNILNSEMVESDKLEFLAIPGNLFLEQIATQNDVDLVIKLLELGVKCDIYIKTHFIQLALEKNIKINDIILMLHKTEQHSEIIETVWPVIKQKNIRLSREATYLLLKSCCQALDEIDIQILLTNNQFFEQDKEDSIYDIFSELAITYFEEKIESTDDLNLAIDLMRNSVQFTLEQQYKLLDFAMQQKPIDLHIFNILNNKTPLIFKDDKNNEKINIYKLKLAISAGKEMYTKANIMLNKLTKHKLCKNIMKIETYASLSIQEFLINGDKAWENFNSAMHHEKISYKGTLPILLNEALTYFLLIYDKFKDFNNDLTNNEKQDEIKHLLQSEYGIKALGFLGMNLDERDLSTVNLVENAMQKIYGLNDSLFSKPKKINMHDKSKLNDSSNTHLKIKFKN